MDTKSQNVTSREKVTEISPFALFLGALAIIGLPCLTLFIILVNAVMP